MDCFSIALEMSVTAVVKLTREVDAIAIPAGVSHTLSEGTEVFISQELGGTFTVHARGSLYRIEGKDADALGREPTQEHGVGGDSDSVLDDDAIWQALKQCFDPEIPVNIVDLGLIYDMGKRQLPNGKYKVFVKMTLTAPGCGMGEVIANDARQKILAIDQIDDALVELVWDPPWHQSMISEQGRIALNMK